MRMIKKGEFGYISFQRKWTVIRTILFFAICALVFAVGYITTGSRKNLLTIVSILGCLPACKSFVNVCMFYRAKGCSQKAYEAISPIAKELYGLYDLYMTSYNSSYAISHLVISGSSIVALSEDSDCVTGDAEKHIQEHLKQDGVKNMTVKVFDNLGKYTDRLTQIDKLEVKPLANQDSIMEMLISISL